MIALRRAAAGDSDTVFAWRNTPYIVERSSSRRTVTPEEHRAWFARALTDPQCRLFMVERDGAPIGQVRLDRETPEECVVSIYLVESSVGRGHGTAALRAGVTEAWSAWPVRRVAALVREDNPPAQRFFLGAGFAPDDAGARPAGHRRYVAMRPA